MNNLNDLNSVLFDTINQLKEGKIEVSTANAVKGLSDTVINGAKTLLQAHKQANASAAPDFFQLPEPQPRFKAVGKPKATDAQGKSPGEILANREGFQSVAACRAELGEVVYAEKIRAIKKELESPFNRM
jgi:hypothetical protein